MGRSCVVSLLGLALLFLSNSSAFAQAFICPDSPRAIAAGDFNGDKKLDVALVRQGSASVFVRLGDGSGGLEAPTAIPSGLLQPHSLVAGDFVTGGGLDLMVAGFTSSGIIPRYGLSILTGDGTGGFQITQRFINLGFTLGVPHIAAGDFNGDGKLDLALADGSSQVFIFLQTSGGFVQASQSSFPFQLTDIALGKFNGDNKLDLAAGITFGVPGQVAIGLGDGAGGLQVRSPFSTGGIGPRALTAKDFNSDGKLDLAVLHFNSNNVSIFLGDGNGSFALSDLIPLPEGDDDRVVFDGGTSLLALDFNGDGHFDLAAARTGDRSPDDHKVVVHFGDGTGGFPTPPRVFNPGFEPRAIAAGDFNGDGLPDLAANFFCGDREGVFKVGILLNPLPPPKPLVYVTVKKEDKVAVLDPETDDVIENIPVGRKPDGITILPNGSKLYVVAEQKPPPSRGRIVVIKTAVPPDSHTMLTMIPVGRKARGIAAVPVPLNPDGMGARFFIYVAEEGERSVAVIDTESDTLINRVSLDQNGPPSDTDDEDEDDPHPLGEKPIDIAFSPEGHFAYVLTKGGSVVVLDTFKAVTNPANAILTRIPVPHRPEVVAADPLEQFIYVGRERHGDGELLILNASEATALTVAGTIGVGRRPKGIAIRSDGSRLYVSNHKSDDVTVISRSGSTHTVLDPSVPVGRRPLGIAILPDSTKVYVADERSDTVSVIKTSDNTVTATVPVGDDPRRIAAGRVPTE